MRERGDIAAEVSQQDLERYQKAYTQQQTRSVIEVIDDINYRYIVILGDPGSGKSTLLKYLALQWAKLSANQLSSQPIHLLIELRKYNRSRDEKECKDFLEFMECGSSWIGHLNKSILHECLQAGRAVVMFDGLDEVFEVEKRNRIVDQIHNFTQTYPTVKVLVTSRIIGYQQQRLKNAEFHHFMLQDFEPEQIKNFIQKWHDLTFTDRLKKAASLERLQKAISESRAILELAGNPLLLTMMAILNRNQELPRFRAKLYEEASKVLLHKWDFDVKERLGHNKIDPYLIDEEVKQIICGRIAYKMQSSGKGLAGNIINREDLRQTITDSLSGLMGNEATACAKLMVEQLRERNFILCFLGGYNEDYYAFVHRTFLEYFCAWEFLRQFQKQKTLDLDGLIQVYREHWRDESWHEVLRLIAGMLDARFTGEILEYLIGENGESAKFSNLFLAAECVSEVKKRNEIADVADKVRDRVKELCRLCGNWAVQEVAVQKIARGWKDDPETLPLLKEWARSDDDSLFRQVVQEIALACKDDPETLPLLKEWARSDDDSDVQEAAVQEILRAWKDGPEILSILQQSVRFNHNLYIRGAAVQEIARGWKDDPETLPLLKEWVRSDDNSSVRRAAVQEIARWWKDDSETLPILKERARSDNDSDVRRAAVQEIARGWKDDPETLPILKERARSDNDSDVRRVAVQAIARGWKDEPGIFELLCDIAINDPLRAENCHQPNPRQTALEAIIELDPERPETLAILRDRAQNDRDQKLREFAQQKLAELEGK